MERLTRPTVKVDESAARYMVDTGGIAVNLYCMNDRFLELILNGPTINGVKKDILRQMIRALYDTLQRYEDTGLEPEEVDQIRKAAERMMFDSAGDFVCYALSNFWELEKYRKAEQEGRLVVLPCKVGDTVYMTHRIFGKTCITEEQFSFSLMEWLGKTVFLTREEAEKALRGGTHE